MEYSPPQDRIWISPAMLRRPAPPVRSEEYPEPPQTRSQWSRKTRLSAEASEFHPARTILAVADAELNQSDFGSYAESPESIRSVLPAETPDHVCNAHGEDIASSATPLGCVDFQEISFDERSFDSDEVYTTNSRVWVASKIVEIEKWQKTKGNLQRMSLIPKSPILPTNFPEWLQHRTEFLDLQVDEAKEKMEMKERVRMELAELRVRKIHAKKPLGGLVMVDGRGSVLAQKTIWNPWLDETPRHKPAPWPTCQEMKEEGDERHTSGYGRFLALPRAPGNPTVNHKQRSVVTSHHFDRVWPVPRGGPCYDDEGEEYDEEYMRSLMGKDLLDIL